MSDLFYIQDTRSIVGNCAMWWRPEGNGYTTDLNHAWKVTGDWKGRATDVLRPVEEVDALAERHVDVQTIGRKK